MPKFQKISPEKVGQTYGTNVPPTIGSWNYHWIDCYHCYPKTYLSSQTVNVITRLGTSLDIPTICMAFFKGLWYVYHWGLGDPVTTSQVSYGHPRLDEDWGGHHFWESETYLSGDIWGILLLSIGNEGIYLCKVGPPFDSVQLVNITPMSLWFMVLIVLIGAFVNQLITFGGPTLHVFKSWWIVPHD